jgi:hypothetical protein
LTLLIANSLGIVGAVVVVYGFDISRLWLAAIAFGVGAVEIITIGVPRLNHNRVLAQEAQKERARKAALSRSGY